METKESSIYGLLLEVQSKPSQRQAHFNDIDKLKPVLSKHNGLLWLQRYQLLDLLELILSHQYWAAEAPLEGSEANLYEITYG